MTTVKIDGRVVLQKPARALHPNYFEPKPVIIRGKVSGDPKYGGELLIEPEGVDHKAIKAKAAEVAKARWPGRDLKELAFPWKDGDKEAARLEAKDMAEGKQKDRAIYRGQVVLKANSKFPPSLGIMTENGVQDIPGGENDPNRAKFYNGCMLAAEVNLVAYDGVGANPDGITAYLNSAVALKGGDRIGGKSASSTFAAYVGHVSAEDPTAGADTWE